LLLTIVATLLCHGCPTQAIVAAFGFDERTVARRLQRTGQHCQHLHEHLVQQGQVDLQHVQVDELYIKAVGRRLRMAMAMAVSSRLWLGGVISPRRDTALITALVEMVHSSARSPAILACVDGLAKEQSLRQTIETKSPQELGIASASWTRQAVRELIRDQVGIRLPIGTVGADLRRWGLTPQEPVRTS
jgi:transposase-like protein